MLLISSYIFAHKKICLKNYTCHLDDFIYSYIYSIYIPSIVWDTPYFVIGSNYIPVVRKKFIYSRHHTSIASWSISGWSTCTSKDMCTAPDATRSSLPSMHVTLRASAKCNSACMTAWPLERGGGRPHEWTRRRIEIICNVGSTVYMY